MEEIEEIEREHDELRLRILEFISLKKEPHISIPDALSKLQRIAEFWNEHEAKEEVLFKKFKLNHIKFPIGKMDLAHKQLKGHWQAMHETIKTKDFDKIQIALETDGKMFVDKLIKHIDIEEGLFNAIPESQFVHVHEQAHISK